MNAVTSVPETEMLFNRLFDVCKNLSSDRTAVWDVSDKRKSAFFFGLEVSADTPLGFIINQDRMMMAFMFSEVEQKFHLRFYWLSFECSPGYLSEAMPYAEAAALLAEFSDGLLVLNSARAESLRLHKVPGKPETFVRDNAAHRALMAEIFNVSDFAEHVKSLK